MMQIQNYFRCLCITIICNGKVYIFFNLMFNQNALLLCRVCTVHDVPWITIRNNHCDDSISIWRKRLDGFTESATECLFFVVYMSKYFTIFSLITRARECIYCLFRHCLSLRKLSLKY